VKRKSEFLSGSGVKVEVYIAGERPTFVILPSIALKAPSHRIGSFERAPSSVMSRRLYALERFP